MSDDDIWSLPVVEDRLDLRYHGVSSCCGIGSLVRHLGLAVQHSGVGMVGRWAKCLVSGRERKRERERAALKFQDSRNWTEMRDGLGGPR